MRKLDRNRSYGEVRGTERSGARFVQDGILFDGQGNELGTGKAKKWVDPVKKAERTAVVPGEPTHTETIPKSARVVADGPVIDLDQPFFSLKAEVSRRTGKTPKNKDEARQFAEEAGLLA